MHRLVLSHSSIKFVFYDESKFFGFYSNVRRTVSIIIGFFVANGYEATFFLRRVFSEKDGNRRSALSYQLSALSLQVSALSF